MIELTKIDGSKITINADEIESVETLHDTIIMFRSGHRISVKEKSVEITQLVMKYKYTICNFGSASTDSAENKAENKL